MNKYIESTNYQGLTYFIPINQITHVMRDAGQNCLIYTAGGSCKVDMTYEDVIQKIKDAQE